MLSDAMAFEFDPEKSAANLAKHGIDFDVAKALWDDENAISGPAVSLDEDRWMRVAKLDGKLWSAIYTFRDGIIRLISVRRSRAGEARQYEWQQDES
jgi:uncharacterized DUF497 family protein